MRKNYNQPEVEIILIVEETVSTASVVTYDPDGLLNGDADVLF